MNEAKKHVVAIAGLGVVGGGVVSILEAGRESIARRTGVEIVIAKAAEKDAVKAAEAGVPPEKVIGDACDLIEDPSIETVVEVIGGTGYAREFVLGALSAGKNVVTANKALLAEHGTEIFKAARENGVVVGFEASVAGGVPIIRTLREAYAGDNIRRIVGILNGTCNYILTRMSREGVGFQDALTGAKARGYAEADPTLDISGTDSAHKIVILARLAFGEDFGLDEVYCEGISGLETVDIEYAAQLGYRVKLLAVAKKSGEEVGLRVHPCLVKDAHPLAHVDGVFNSVYVEGEYAGETMLYGQGAGRWPTASAVVADLIDVATGRAGTLSFGEPRGVLGVKSMSRMLARYYIRFQAIDRPGVLAGIAGVLGQEGISIAQAIQKGRREGQSVPVVIITHEAAEGAVQKALLQIGRLDIVTGKSVLLREEE
ncbi:MAG: homoserine dehydrogenase [Planctomycetes bacterium]|nr:homoserine dehydrogenase [Planctomycetota bacterium]